MSKITRLANSSLCYFLLQAMSLTKAEFRKALGQFATGVTVVTVLRAPGEVHGMTANSFTSVSLEPVLVLVCVDHRARTLPLALERKRFGINILAAHQQDLSEYFAQPEQLPEDARRLGVHYGFSERGTPLLSGSLVQLECALVSSYVAGDHTILLAEVESAEISPGSPLVFFAGQYRRLPEQAGGSKTQILERDE